MENQNSATPAKKGFFASLGKRRKVIIIVLVVLLLIGMMGRWFTFGAARGYRGYSLMESGNVALVVKDFEPRGIVFADAAGWDGYRTTYDALMKEAAQKGADAIINVNISSTGILFNRKWSGSALAVKYLDAVTDGTTGIIPAETALMTRGWWFGR
ncbi:MAG: hypothetical protein LBQ94_02330 [Treponema sp.]|jgi:flagellar basal body-associated protein FliL|nr:hypothetical protein [Treponema sp.]